MPVEFMVLFVILACNIAILIGLSWRLNRFHQGYIALESGINHTNKQQIEMYKLLQDTLQQGITDNRQQLFQILTHNTDALTKQVDKLSQQTAQHLKEISGQVEKRLLDGFEKTTATFNDVLKRLVLIDEAQKKITELSTHVVNLQNVLANKSARGAFGEVQLATIIDNVLPPSKYAFQYTLSNGKRADCVLFLPKPTGTIAIDAKFPLENFQRMLQCEPKTPERIRYENQFRADIYKHIEDVANKYIIPGETAEGAILFIPAEAVFAEIHAHFPDLVETSHRINVWLVSPSTLMAILTTASAVLKDEETRQQIHVIQEHLVELAKDFLRFQQRMDNLAKHIQQANEDVHDVHISAKKITSRFQKIEKVELTQQEKIMLDLEET